MQAKRSFVSLMTALSFVVLAVSGILAFVQPFSIRIVGLHVLTGFVFIALIGLHLLNNQGHLKRHLRSKSLWVTVGIVSGLPALFLWQPGPIRGVLGLSSNLGPALERFEMSVNGLVYRYSPSPSYKMALTIRAGTAFEFDDPPHIAIWLENASSYHIQTLHQPPEAANDALPYWDFKVRSWKSAKRDAERSGMDLNAQLELDGVSGATQNSSFDPADYVLPADPDNPMPYRLLIEIEQPGDNQPSLVYSVEVHNSAPQAFQLLDLVGFPKREADDEGGREVWALYFVDETFGSALKLIDSALLTIDRAENS